MVDHNEIAKKSWGDIQPPALLPVGCWSLTCRAAKLMPPKKEGGKLQVLFMFEATEPMSDVSDEALAQLGDNWEERVENIAHRPWFESASDMQKVRKLLVKLGVTNVDELSIEQSLKAAVNGTVVGYVVQETFTGADGTPGTKNAVSHFMDQAA